MNQIDRTKTVTELFDLTGRTALVTGGSGWLGNALCEALAEAGATVVVSSRNAERAETVANSLPSIGHASHQSVELDHLSADSIQQGFDNAVNATGQVDVLVNNGLALVSGDVTNITSDDFAQHQVNNAGYFELARRFRDHVVDRSATGSVINIGSMYGQVASYPQSYEGICSASSVAYHTLKGGTIHMTRHLAVYWAKDPVRVNCLSPGAFPNPASAPAEMIERLEEHVPMQRMGVPEELKGAIVFLASDASSYMTGQNITIDGGWTAW